MFGEIAALVLGIVDKSLELANEVEKKRLSPIVSRIRGLQLEIQNEERRGYDSDDSKIETLMSNLKIELETLNREMAYRSTVGNS